MKRTGEREVRMKEYMKPVLLTSDELAEGVYLASGDGSGCYTTTAYIHQTPQTGRGDYRIQVNAVHNADHTKEAQQLNISFNQPVTYVSGGRGCTSGDGTSSLCVSLGYHQNPNDNIGLVVFAAESFTQCPLTTDHTVLLNLFKDVQPGIIQDGTAIGLGLANAVSRIKDSQAKSKVIILLTDGVNNQGEIAPVTAAEIAKTFGVRVYTIGVGTQGKAPYPFQTAFGVQYMDVDVEIDEPTLKQIAATTGGQYFRATDNASLKEIYSEIDKMEKTKISVQEYSKKQEEYKNWAILLFSLLLVEILLRNTLLRNIP